MPPQVLLIASQYSLNSVASKVLLESMGWTVVTSASISNTRQVLQENSDWDFVITEMFFEDGSCADIVKMTQRLAKRPFVLAADSFKPHHRKRCWETGVDAVFDLAYPDTNFRRTLIKWNDARN